MVKLWPHRQVTATGTPYTKLAKRFYGPFQILEKNRKVAYKLKLPDESRIHLVFHCSVLKHFHSSTGEVVTQFCLPKHAYEIQPLIAPLAVLNTCWNQNVVEPRLEVLVQWEGLSPDDTSWEDWVGLKTDYHLEDMVFLEGMGVIGYELKERKWPIRKPLLK